MGGKLPTNCEKCLDVAEGQGIDREIARVRYGRGEDAVLLWKEGMDLPAASAAGEEAWGCEAGSAAYWAEPPEQAKGPAGENPGGPLASQMVRLMYSMKRKVNPFSVMGSLMCSISQPGSLSRLGKKVSAPSAVASTFVRYTRLQRLSRAV